MGEPFGHGLRVRCNECDPQGIVFNANYLTCFDITITEMWRTVGGKAPIPEAIRSGLAQHSSV